jgi:hypothetical protein
MRHRSAVHIAASPSTPTRLAGEPNGALVGPAVQWHLFDAAAPHEVPSWDQLASERSFYAAPSIDNGALTLSERHGFLSRVLAARGPAQQRSSQPVHSDQGQRRRSHHSRYGKHLVPPWSAGVRACQVLMLAIARRRDRHAQQLTRSHYTPKSIGTNH